MSVAAIASTTLVAETSGSIIRSTVAALLIRTEEQRTDSEGRHGATHSLIGKRRRVNNSAVRTAISIALTVAKQEIVAARMLAAIVIAMLQGIGVQVQIGAGAQPETGHQVEIQLARAIDLATREIAAMEIELVVATLEAALAIAVLSEIPEAAVAVRVPAATEVLPAWVVREGVAAEQVVRVARVAERAAQVAVVAAVAVAVVVAAVVGADNSARRR